MWIQFTYVVSIMLDFMNTKSLTNTYYLAYAG